MKRFVLFRITDTSGISGVGIVAEGIQFSDGVCALRWVTEWRSTAVYMSIAHVERIHGHGGNTEVRWIDE